MTHEMAMRILDKVREGTPYPQIIIRQALMMTGDLDELLKESGEQCGGQGAT
jgi:hypothetical protein